MELASVQSKRAAAQERIAKEQAITAKLDADGVALAAAITKLQESRATLVEELWSVPVPVQPEVWHEATAISQEDSQDLESWLEGDSLAFVKEQRAAMGDDKFLQLGSLLKGKGKGVRAGPYG